MKVAVASDHRGVKIRPRVIEIVRHLGHEPVDYGVDHPSPVDYPDVAFTVARTIVDGKCDCGILLCGTGVGMAIAANKVPGIIAATCHDEITTELSRRHNDANILCLSAELLGERTIERAIEIFLTTEFEGGRHARRLNKIRQYEQGRKPPEMPLLDSAEGKARQQVAGKEQRGRAAL